MNKHHFGSTGEAYDACQCDENIKDGDLLIIEPEQVVGIAWTWPIAVTAQCGVLHTLKPDGTFENFEGGMFARSAEAAREFAAWKGWPVR